MARATLTFEGIKTLNDLSRAVVLAESIGFPLDSTTDAPVSGLSGARFSVSCALHLIPDPDEEPTDD